MKKRFKLVLSTKSVSSIALVLAIGCGDGLESGNDAPGVNGVGAGNGGTAADGGSAIESAGGEAGADRGEGGRAGNRGKPIGGDAGDGAGGDASDGAGGHAGDGAGGVAGDGAGGVAGDGSGPADACAEECQAPHATTECVASECVIAECEEGYVDCNEDLRDGCEARDTGFPDEPKPIAPVLGAYTGSVHVEVARMPRFQWAPSRATSCDAVIYELQVDDSCPLEGFASCDFPSPEVHEAEIEQLEWTPEKPLPVAGVAPVGTRYFWRVRACEGPERCSGWSSVRYVDVGRLRDDLNGDGYSDLFALSLDTASPYRTYINSGGAELSATPDVALESDYDRYGEARWVGDVNGDGYADALRMFTGPPTLFLGGPDLQNLETVTVPETPELGSWSAGGAGDWNGDGYADIVAAEYTSSELVRYERVGVLRLYFGNSEATLIAPLEVKPPAGATPIEFGIALEGGIDMNGDGLPDVFILDGDDARIHAMYGSATGRPRIDASFTTGTPCHYYDRATLLAAGDLNGDGFGDLAALCRPRALVYVGGPSPALTPHWSVTLEPRDASIAGGQDLGDDGYPDLLIGAGDDSGTTLSLLPGSAEFSSESELVPFAGSFGEIGELAGYGLTVGDHDGDGRADVAAQVSNASRIRWFRGVSSDQATTATCAQPESSFASVGNWCSAQTHDVDGILTETGADDASTPHPVGPSFGHTLAR